MKQFWRYLILLAAGTVLLAVAGCGAAPAENPRLKIGTLPVEDSLPLYVAADKGYFADQQVEVELVPFQSAVERDSALQAGAIDGQISDLVAAALLKGGGVPLKVTSVTLGVTPEQGRFAILASPGSGIDNIDQLKNVEVAVSQNSIIEYVDDQLLQGQGFTPSEIKKTVVPKIPVRLEMLMNDQIKAACLPDPQASLAQKQGARLIIDDTKDNVSQVVLLFRSEAIQAKQSAIGAMYRAYSQAVEDINAAPESYRSLFVEKAGIPEPIKDTYKVPQYSHPQPPTEEQVDRVLQWLSDKNLLQQKVTYNELVNTDLLLYGD